MPARPSQREILLSCLKLGLTSFGGPTAHLAYFHEEFVRRRQWLSDQDYAEIVALSQFLPGPASSQTIFAIGLKHGGWLGGALASLGFTLPSAVIMTALAYGVSQIGNLEHAGWLTGLKLAAVAVVAKALVDMARSLCPDLRRAIIGILCACTLILFPLNFLPIALISATALAFGLLQKIPTTAPTPSTPVPRHAPVCLITFAALLLILPILNHTLHNPSLSLADGFYRAGSAVFGGGHVVLPLLEAETVKSGWVTKDAFLAGYGAAQAIPGPLFTFAAFLGTVAQPGTHAWTSGLLCLLALFLPGWLLMAGALPYWDRLRHHRRTQAALQGANAAVVGILAAAFWHPVITSSIHQVHHALIAATGFALLQWTKCPPWLWVLLAAGLGQWWT